MTVWFTSRLCLSASVLAVVISVVDLERHRN